jgi:hypothetical protein
MMLKYCLKVGAKIELKIVKIYRPKCSGKLITTQFVCQWFFKNSLPNFDDRFLFKIMLYRFS